jgi:hypothetical protein
MSNMERRRTLGRRATDRAIAPVDVEDGWPDGEVVPAAAVTAGDGAGLAAATVLGIPG